MVVIYCSYTGRIYILSHGKYLAGCSYRSSLKFFLRSNDSLCETYKNVRCKEFPSYCSLGHLLHLIVESIQRFIQIDEEG